MKIIRKKLGIAGDLYEVEMPDDDRLELIAALDMAVEVASSLPDKFAGLANGVTRWRQLRKDLEVRS